ncbi:methyl-accepting chemotaxis protein [Pseudoduganella violacea]|uniref:Methyl-accepting chemotaxis protein n=1 Tax=Pseudoduganella violacea TaxID=1715466 RepID=A0A7W5FRY7_9BURK|nr:methyl-accepting chemotaxis protein [Pseudoduganella violacea]MBB3117170.1 methyl-accepting chemotaxis protein [Pseudoduganella violacea]
MSIRNLKIGMRIGGGFVVLLVLVVLMAVLGMVRMRQIEDQLLDIAKVNNVEAQLLVRMRVTILDRAIAARNVVLLTEAADMKPEAERIEANEKKYAEAETELNRMFSTLAATTDKEKASMVKIKASEQAVLPPIRKVVELGLANRNEEAVKVLMKEVRPAQRVWLDDINELLAFEDKLNQEAIQEAESVYANARNWMVAITVAAIVFGLAIAWWITRSVTQPINAAVEAAQTVASGDLTREIQVNTNDETGQLLQALKEMSGSLEDIVGRVRHGTNAIAVASSEIANGNMDLSSRTEQQASSLEETASSMEELTSTVQQNADNARQANQLVVSATEVAVKGGSIVTQVVETMGAINASATKIVDIISVIDGIAFQTNILALNAAVEAARAGEQGRGFAVVASEVRNLAQRSAAAAKEIKALIGDSVEKVQTGSKLVDEAGGIMQEVVKSVQHVSDIISEITSASVEQSTGISQVNQAIVQMDDVTQQNASLVEQAAAAAGSLKDQAEGLVQVVSVFKINGGAANSYASAPKPQARPVAAAMPKPAPRKIAVKSAAAPRGMAASKPAAGGDDWEEF